MRWLDFALVAAVTIALATSVHIVQGDRRAPPKPGTNRPRGVASLVIPTTLSLVGGAETATGAPAARAVWIEVTASGRSSGGAADFEPEAGSSSLPHYVIGNGKGAGDGEVQLTSRGRSGSIDAATPRLRVCLIGNFQKDEPTPSQTAALVDLCRRLSMTYGIPPDRITSATKWEGLSIAWLRDQLRK